MTPDQIAKLYYRMNPEDKTHSTSWEAICNYFDSINWYWRPRTW
jgi:hypothetical protein